MQNTVKENRLLNELTQLQLADLAKVSRQTIISIETNRYQPSVLLALKIATLLKTKVEQLFILEDND